MMYYVFKTISLLLNLVNVIAHTFGCYLLVLVQVREKRNNTQLVYLIHLSICEAIMNFLQLLWLTPRFFITHCDTEPFPKSVHAQHINSTQSQPCSLQAETYDSSLGNASSWSQQGNNSDKCSTIAIDSYCSLYQDLDHYLQIVMYLGVSVVFYLNMILLTLDRLMRVLFITEFPFYWTLHRAKTSMVVAWLIGLGCFSVSLVLHFTVTEYKWKDIAFKYFFTTLQ